MALTKSQIINNIAQQNRFIRKKSTETVEAFLDIIKSRLKFAEDVLISGFGKIWLFNT
jgi:nucleoid DNA-binding protein